MSALFRTTMRGLSTAVGDFLQKVEEYPTLRNMIEPPMPQGIADAQAMITRFEIRPSRSLHRAFADLAGRWDTLEEQYGTRIEEYGANLPTLHLPPPDEDVVRRGYDGLRRLVEHVGGLVKIYGKAHHASVFAEQHAGEFRDFLHHDSAALHESMRRGEKGWGGIITYTPSGFEIVPRPRGDAEMFTTLLAQAKSGNPAAGEELGTLLQYVLADAARHASAVLPSDQLAVEVSRAKQALRSLEEGVVTPFIEAVVAAHLEGTYTHDTRVFADEQLFSPASQRRLFAFYQIHPLEGIYPSKEYKGPHREEMRLSWDMGPQAVFVPEQQELDTYLVIRGDIALNRAFPI